MKIGTTMKIVDISILMIIKIILKIIFLIKIFILYLL